MARTADYGGQACAVAAALQVVGDPWTLLIVRDVLRGQRRFEELQASLGCARNVLAARLKALVAEDVLVRRPYSERPPRFEYAPTDKARELFPVIAALMAWGDRYVYGDSDAPVQLTHTCGERFQPRLTCTACGGSAGPRDVKARTVGGERVADAFARRQAAAS